MPQVVEAPGSVLYPFAFEGREVRVQVDGAGEPWFCAADVCEVLSYPDASMALRPLEPDEKGQRQTLTRGGPQSLLHMNEPGLYRLLMRSDKPQAKPFQRWVTHDVLPTIRRTGTYVAPTAAPESEDALVLRAMGVLQGRVALLQAQNDVLSATTERLTKEKEEAAPAVDFYMRYANSDGLTGLRDAGRIFTGHPDKWIGSLRGTYLFRSDGVLVPYSQYGIGGRALFTLKQRTVPTKDGERIERQTFVTAKGMQHFAALLGAPAGPLAREAP